jgi:nitrile hydratase accessory protein
VSSTTGHRLERQPDQVERQSVERLVEQLPNPEAAPRDRGVLAFTAPWEIRAFSLAVAAHTEGRFPWADFQARLISAIRDWEAVPPGERGEWSYYRLWLRALEDLVLERRLTSAEEIESRTREYLNGRRGPGHR